MPPKKSATAPKRKISPETRARLLAQLANARAKKAMSKASSMAPARASSMAPAMTYSAPRRLPKQISMSTEYVKPKVDAKAKMAIPRQVVSLSTRSRLVDQLASARARRGLKKSLMG